MMKRMGSGCWLLALFSAIQCWGASAGDSVVVVYNKNLPESKTLAEYYARKRGVPTGQLFGADVSASSETMSRGEFRSKLEDPLFDWLVKEKLFAPNPKKRVPKETEYHAIIGSRIRYVVLCYGIPLKIVRDSSVKDNGGDKIPEPMRGRNEAAVDAELALLPNAREPLPLTGPTMNPFYLHADAAIFHPTNGIMMVTRLDGPTVEIARGLVDKALQAEANGLWGHAYIDSRGITNGEYKLGDDWMRSAAAITFRQGFETILDEKEATFDAAFPMSQIGFYAGWYSGQVTGPFTRPTMEFMPGAFAYHLFSYSANTLRSSNQSWVATFLAKGITITMGSVDEPYLSGTPNPAVFLERLIGRRWSFGEAAYACQSALSWQTTVVGDPLYAPFAQPPEVLHAKLEREKNPLIEWSHLRVMGLNLATGLRIDALIKYVDEIPAVATNSAVLQEKLGFLYLNNKRISAACEAFTRALQLKPTPLQKVRLLLSLGQWQSSVGRTQEAFDAYKQLVAEVPDFADAAKIYRDLADLARKLGKDEEAKKFEEQAQRSAAK